MRGSDPDAAIFWLAKMLAAGEDPRFIARRILILASEDVGNADPQALLVAAAAAEAVEPLRGADRLGVVAQAAARAQPAEHLPPDGQPNPEDQHPGQHHRHPAPVREATKGGEHAAQHKTAHSGSPRPRLP
jgi:hypothetical protein